MATQFEIDCALMAGRVYESTRSTINYLPVPDGWVEFFHRPVNGVVISSGFEASAFVSMNNSNNIVISYAGTYPGDFGGDWVNNLALGFVGVLSAQMVQAADYYMDVKIANPNAQIIFTGHSLGGGLASLMAVFFNQPAITFDQAPFGNAANLNVATELRAHLLSKYPTQTALLTQLDSFIDNVDAGLASRSANVTDTNVQGEFLSQPLNVLIPIVNVAITTILTGHPELAGFLPSSVHRIGSEVFLNHGTPASLLDPLLASNLHSQALQEAFLLSTQKADTDKSLRNVTFKFPDLIKLIFDDKLFYHPTTDENNENFIERLVRHQIGITGSATETTITSDAMLTRFTADLWKLAQDGGLTMTDNDGILTPNTNNVSKALIAFAMQMYYEDTPNAKDATKQLFTAVTGGVQFDMADVSQKILAAFTQSNPPTLSDAKGYKEYFSQYINGSGSNYSEEERNLIRGILPSMRDWYVQAGTSGMNATDTHNRHAFMLGGGSDDTLTGGNKADLLVGNSGADTLSGGAGDDALLGATGNDTLKGEDDNDWLNGGLGNDDLNGGAGNDILEGDATDGLGGGLDTLDGGEGNDQLKGGWGNDTYTFTGSFGTDIVTDVDGSGSIQVNSQTLNNANRKFGNIYKDDTSGYTFTRLNDGKSIAITKEDDSNRIIINDWSTFKNLGLNLTGEAPAAPDATLTGDFKKKIDDHGTADTSDDTYILTNNNYTPDETAPDGEVDALDLINGTAGNDTILGLGGDDALSGKEGDDHIDGGIGGDVLQGGLGKDTLIGGAGDDYVHGGAGGDEIYDASDVVFSMPTDVNFTSPSKPYKNGTSEWATNDEEWRISA